jgi:subtilisin family serine protease
VQGDTWKTYRSIKQVVREDHPHIINMSYGGNDTTSVKAARRKADRAFRYAYERGALPFAAAGNDGVDVDAEGAYLPCESEYVVCVGGMGSDTTAVSGSSNYSTKAGRRSVEIYGPYCVVATANPQTPTDGTIKGGCGTSHASPYVAGIAALVKAANPSLSAGAVRDTILDNAHRGGLGSKVTGSQRRVDAYAAVADALGVTWTDPAVSIDDGVAGSYRVDDFVVLSGAAQSFTGQPLGIRWQSSIDGPLNKEPMTTDLVVTLSPGTHAISAHARDLRGEMGSDYVQVVVKNKPPTVAIISPADGAERLEGTHVTLSGFSDDPDDHQNLDHSQVLWEVERIATGEVVFEAEAHEVIVAGGTLSPGDYRVRFSGSDEHGGADSDERTLTIVALPPGYDPPTVQIIDPKPGTELWTGGGADPTLRLRASAKAGDGSALAGTELRWTAVSQAGTTIVLCTGSSFPGAGDGGGFITYKDCGDVEVSLGLDPKAGAGMTRWTITVEVDSGPGVPPVSASRSVDVFLAVP